jgi:hypothetical protein
MLIDSNDADTANFPRHAPDFGLCEAHAKVLRNARINPERAVVSACVRGIVGIFRDQLHVHERGLARFIEALVGHHRVIPVERGARVGRACGGWAAGRLQAPIAVTTAEDRKQQNNSTERF